MRKYLVVAFKQGEPDRHVVVSGDECIIGRVPESDLLLPDPTISRRHAVVRISDKGAFVQDLDSVNGVFVNGEQVRLAAVREGDFVTMGAYTLVVRALTERDDEAPPKGKTVCIANEVARKFHEESLEKHVPKHFLALYKAALLLGERLGTDELLQKVLALAVEALSARRGIIVLDTDDGGGRRIAASVCLNPEYARLVVNMMMVDYVLRTGAALLTEDAAGDPRFRPFDVSTRYPGGPAMCVCFRGAARPLGVIFLDKEPDTGVFSKQDLEFLSTLGHLVGVSLDNRLLDRRMAKQDRLAALGQAVAEISHDVRNVLSGLKMSIDLTERACKEGDWKKSVTACNLLKSASDRVEAYLGDLLAFVKRTDLKCEPTYVNGLVQNVLELLGPLAMERNVTVTFPGGGFEPANVDGAQLHLVLLNIIKNGIEACGEEGGGVSISVSRRSDTLMIQVTDTGEGIRAEDIPRLSEPFFTGRKKGGTGLGLALSFRIVEQHGGHISVTSAEGKGSTFRIVIPRVFGAKGAASLQETRGGLVEDAFKKCPRCNAVWRTQEAFLADPSLELAGYQVHFEELTLGLFLFNHACGTTLAVPAGDFRHFYDGTIFAERLTGTETCPRYCLHETELRRCPAKCECAYVREVLQIVHNWPKR